jgi:hypothetical protein
LNIGQDIHELQNITLGNIGVIFWDK